MHPLLKAALILHIVGTALVIASLSVGVYALGKLGGYW